LHEHQGREAELLRLCRIAELLQVALMSDQEENLGNANSNRIVGGRIGQWLRTNRTRRKKIN
jgi:hypothetical protein